MRTTHTLPSGAACPCGQQDAKQRVLGYPLCCGRFITAFDTTPAPTAEALMRSRYSAFVLQDATYLLATWHASTRPASLDFDPSPKWLGLDVRAHQATGVDTAEVEFVARYRVEGRAVRLHERSRFVHENARWFYVDGDSR